MTKFSKYQRLQLIAIALLFIFTAESRAQIGIDDTIQHRVLRLTMNDSLSSEFDYEIGQIRHVSVAGYSYIPFTDSSTPLITNYLKTQSFVVGGSDSLYFYRFLWFDNSSKYSGSPQNLSPTQVDSIMNYIKTKYTNRYIFPDSSYFTSSSFIKFIAILYNASSATPISYIDTLDCILNSGALRYINYPQSVSWRKIKLSNYIPVGDTVYLAILVQSSLPARTSLTATATHTIQAEVNIHRGLVPIHQIASWLGTPPGCIAPKIGSNGRPVTSDQLLVKTMYSRTQNMIVAKLLSNESQSAHFELVDMTGKIVKAGDAELSSGMNTLRIPVNNVEGQNYILRIETELFQGETKVNISK